MDWEKIILYTIVMVVINVVVSSLTKTTKKEVEAENDGFITLNLPKLIQVLGYILAFVFAFSLIVFRDDDIFFILTILIFLTIGLPGFILIFFYNNHKIKFNDDKIIVYSWRNKVKEIHWNEITKIKSNPFSGFIKISNADKTLKILHYLVGIKKFAEKVEEKTKWKAKDLKLPYTLITNH